MERLNTSGFQKRLARIEELIQAVNAITDGDLRAKARELIQTLLELHGTGIERMLEIVGARAESETVIAALAGDDLVSNLLLLHGLHPLGLEMRVRQALESVRPRLGLHGGSVELIGVTPAGGVTLRLEGNCHGCPSSQMTLKHSIEEAIYAAAPDVSAIEVEGSAGAAGPGLRAERAKYSECPLPREVGIKNGKERIA